MTEAALPLSRKWRPRFSLLNALFITAIFGLMLLVVQQWREVEPLRKEVRRLRTELGYLVIDDPDKLHAMRAQPIEDLEQNAWRWRLYVPPDERYRLHVFSGRLSSVHPPRFERYMAANRDGLGKLTSWVLPAGEIKLDVRLVNVGGNWVLWTSPGGKHAVDLDSPEWLSQRPDVAGVYTNLRRQQIVEPDQPILLMYLPKPILSESATGRPKTVLPAGDSDGIVVWLEQQPTTPQSTSDPPEHE